MGRPPALIAIGSNLGDSRAHVLAAMDRLDRLGVSRCQRSSLWESTPVECPPDSPQFVNAAVRLEPVAGETAGSLLNTLQAIEREFGRVAKQILNEPRPLDLDLIAFGSETCQTTRLVLPHPRAHLRRFVLEPLNEIAPGFILPHQDKSIRELLRALRTDEEVRRLA